MGEVGDTERELSVVGWIVHKLKNILQEESSSIGSYKIRHLQKRKEDIGPTLHGMHKH